MWIIAWKLRLRPRRLQVKVYWETQAKFFLEPQVEDYWETQAKVYWETQAKSVLETQVKDFWETQVKVFWATKVDHFVGNFDYDLGAYR